MPELPDVAVFKSYFDSTALHQKISDIQLIETEKILRESQRLLPETLIGSHFKSTHRHGKYLFVEIDSGEYLVLHFGMTGFLRYSKEPGQQPNHTRLLVEFDNGYFLAYDCQRKLGGIHIINNIDDFIASKKLGPDALDPTLNESRFTDIITQRRGAIKSTLMNQQIIAGIGNVYSDEILFNAEIYPTHKADQLSKKSLKRIFSTMGEVLKTAIACKVDVDKFPDQYLLPNRRPGAECPKCGGKITKKNISGRSGYLCSAHQR